MEFEVAAYAEPGQLFGVEVWRDVTLAEAEQLAVKRARLVAAAGRDRDRDVLQLQPHGCMQSRETAGPCVLHIDDDVCGAHRRHGEPDPDDDRIAVGASQFDDCSDGWPHGSVDPGDRLVVLEFVDQRADFRLRLWHATSIPGPGLDKPWHRGSPPLLGAGAWRRNPEQRTRRMPSSIRHGSPLPGVMRPCDGQLLSADR